MSYPPGSLRSCHEADGRSDRSGGSGGTGSGSGCGNTYGSVYSSYGDCKWYRHQSQSQQQQLHQQTMLQKTLGCQSLTSNQSLTWQKWAASFDALLSDGEGVALFKSYLESEGCGNLLDFWFAVQGFRSKVDPSDRKKILQLIKVIYQTYIRGPSSGNSADPASRSSSSRRTHTPIRLRPETRRAIADRLAHKSSLDQTVFDEAQAEIGHVLRTSAYQAFLKSDDFITHIQQGGSGKLEQLQADDFTKFSSNTTSYHLPTVEEDRELGQQPLKGAATPSTYHYFCGPPQQQQHCGCQSNINWGMDYLPPTMIAQAQQPCYPPAPLTQENLQMTRFQRAELPVPQHLSCCPHCQTPFQQPQLPSAQQIASNPLSPVQPHGKALGRMNAASVQRKWMDVVCPKYEYCSPPLPNQGGFARAPPNPYHVSFAPVSMQESEHHSLSSGAHTEESLSHTDGVCDDVRGRIHFSSVRHTPRIPNNYPIFEPPLPPTQAAAGPSSGHKHKRGSSSSRRAVSNKTAAAPVVAPVIREQNMAELDPTGFAKLLNERLQRVVEEIEATERLERLMSEVEVEERKESLEHEKTKEVVVEKKEAQPKDASAKTAAEATSVSVTDHPVSTETVTMTTTTATVAQAATVQAPKVPSVLQKPWADRLLAAARHLRSAHGDNAQAILEDHCSRIWDTSADRTPTSSSGGSGGDARNHPPHPAVVQSQKSSIPEATQALELAADKVGRPSRFTTTTTAAAAAATVEVETEELDDDCIQPPLLQEDSYASPPPQPQAPKSTQRYDFHQQVTERHLGHQTRCTASPAPSSNATGASVSSGSGNGSTGSSGLVVGYYLCDDPVPYRSQWPSNVITLGQFKHLVPKKGPFRFFFKTTSDEFDSGVVHQEISNDDAILPLWDGKVVAKVERVEQ